MLLMAMPMAAWCADGDTFTYTTTEGVRLTMMVISEDEKTCQVGNDIDGAFVTEDYEGPVTIPSTASGYTVVRLGKVSLTGNNWSSATSVGLPETLVTIGEEALACWKIQSISIPASVTGIESRAFAGTSVTTITIPETVTELGEGVMEDCHYLTTATINAPITELPTNFFCYCETLANVALPASITMIGNRAFFHCDVLASLILPEGLTTIGDDAFGYSGLESLPLPEGVATIGSYAFNSCKQLATITLPAALAELGESVFSYSGLTSVPSIGAVTEIPISAFEGCEQLVTATIPAGITSIGEFAFGSCPKLKTVTLPEGLLSIKQNAFRDCAAIETITLPEGLEYIGWDAFNGCESLTGIAIPNSVTEIGYYAFYKCEKLATATLSNSLTVLEGGLFNNCKALTALTIPESVTDIYSCIIDSTSVSSIMVPKNVKHLDRDAFIGAPLTALSVDAENATFDSRDNCNAVIRTGGWFHDEEPEMWIGTRNTTFPSSVKYVCGWAFERVAGLKNLVIPEGYLGIGDGAFYDCYDLETVTLPSTLKELDGNAFYQEKNKITTVTANMPTPMAIAKNTFNCYNTATLNVPAGKEETYKATEGWSLFYGIVYTGIDTAKTAQPQVPQQVYDLSGRSVKNPVKGLYIMNGRKVVVK